MGFAEVTILSFEIEAIYSLHHHCCFELIKNIIFVFSLLKFSSLWFNCSYFWWVHDSPDKWIPLAMDSWTMDSLT